MSIKFFIIFSITGLSLSIISTQEKCKDYESYWCIDDEDSGM